VDPLVSVIVPAYNAEKTIVSSIESVLRQTYSRTEILVIDDSSTDNTSQVVSSIRDSRVKLIAGKRKGAASSRNQGLLHAQGDFLQFLDADDLISDDKIRLQIQAIGNTSNIASCAWMHLREDQKLYLPPDRNCWRIKKPTHWLISSLSGEGMMANGCWLVPRHVAQKAGPWDESLCLHDDGEYFCRVLLACDGNVFVDNCHVAYRVVAGSLSRKRSRTAIESAYKVCESRARILLENESRKISKIAIATQWLQFAYEFIDSAPDLSQAAISNLIKLRVSPRNTVGGKLFRYSRNIIGWKLALSLRSRYVSLRR
jgi:glycosyltransferase involved in cell wall biosynthesis